MPTVSECAGCHMRVAGGSARCQEMFDELGARASSNLTIARLRRMMVDVYCLQHPDRYCVSFKSLAAHLTGLCCAVEFGGDQGIYRAVQRWLNGPSTRPKPKLPTFRGSVTIAEVFAAADDDMPARSNRWARSTWDAYAALHPTARSWIAEATGNRIERQGRSAPRP